MKVRLALWAGLALSLLACDKADPNSAEYWIERLQTDERRQAIKKLTEMKAAEALDPLIKAYDDKRHTYQLVSALAKLGDKKAVPVMLKAIQDTTEPEAAKLAAQTLLDWEVYDEIDTYIKVLANLSPDAHHSSVRHVLLKILSKKPNAKATPVLLQILSGDPDVRPIALNGMAAEVLGKLGEPKALPRLIECLWMDDHLHRNAVAECRLAINRIGGDAKVGDVTAKEMLIKTLQRKNRAVEERAKKHKFHKNGLIEAKCAELLGDLVVKEAVEPLVASLKHEEEMPVEYQADPNKMNAFKMGNVQRYISTASALAVIGDDAPVEYMLSRLDVEGGFREILIASIQQLGFLGSDKAVAGLMKHMDKIVEKERAMFDPDSHGLRIQMAINVLNIIDATDQKTLGKFEKAINKYKGELPGYTKKLQERLDGETKKIKAEIKDAKKQAAKLKSFTKAYTPYFDAYKDWDKNYNTILKKLEVIKGCKKDVACWDSKLQEKDQDIRMLAAYRMAHLSDPAIGGMLTKAMKNLGGELKTHAKNKKALANLMAFRNVLLFGLARHATANDLESVKAVRAADAEMAKKDKQFKGLLYPMDLLLAKLSHRK